MFVKDPNLITITWNEISGLGQGQRFSHGKLGC